MQYYHLNENLKPKRKPSTLRILMIVNAVLFAGLLYVLALPFLA